MTSAEIARIAWRYTFARGEGLLSTFLSSLAMLGLVLAIAILIAVMSVMNGFDKEMRERILALVPHITLYAQQPVGNWDELTDKVLQHPDISNAQAFVSFDALFLRGSEVESAQGIGMQLGSDARSAALYEPMLGAAGLQRFGAQPDGLVLGAELAQRLGVEPGDAVSLIVPGAGANQSGARGARSKTLTLSAVLRSGTELDQGAAIVHLPVASALAGLGDGVSGLRLTTPALFDTSRIAWELINNLPSGFYATNWMMTHGNLYAAIQLSRDLVILLLLSVVAVAAFNVVSSLVLVVFDKRGDVAILRTLGASPGAIGWVFVCQGAMIGLVGVIGGTLGGVLLSLAIPEAVAGLERLLDYRFLSTDVYPVSFLPVDIVVADVMTVSGVALLMCVLAAVYPALRAAKLAPAQILHQGG